jgi:NAD(P)H-flavin reductase
MESVVLDGPYGKDLKLEILETAFLFAKGIAISGLLPHALDLVERKTHVDQAYRRGILTRNVDLVWILEYNTDERWISSWKEELKRKDSEKVLLLIVITESSECFKHYSLHAVLFPRERG